MYVVADEVISNTTHPCDSLLMSRIQTLTAFMQYFRFFELFLNCRSLLGESSRLSLPEVLSACPRDAVMNAISTIGGVEKTLVGL